MQPSFTNLSVLPILRQCVLALLCLFGLGLLGGAALAPAHAERKALIIGNASYTHISALKAPLQDAQDMAQALQGLGFASQNIKLHTNLPKEAMQRALREFKASVQEGDDVVVYYTGHGLQLSGNNYMLPTDVPPRNAIMSEDDIKDSTVRLQRVLGDMTERKARFTLLIVDACRDNPIQASKSAGAGTGLGPESPSNGQMIVFAAGTGQIARDAVGSAERNSLFTAVLLEQLKTPGLEVRELVRRVKDTVHERAKRLRFDQLPAVYDQAVGAFYFGGQRTADVNKDDVIAQLRAQLAGRPGERPDEDSSTASADLAAPMRAIRKAYGDAGFFGSTYSEIEGFLIINHGVARDKATGLEWMRCAIGQTWDGNTCIGVAEKFTFEEALQRTLKLNDKGGFAGKRDWRRPTHRELFSLIRCSSGIGKHETMLHDDGAKLRDGCLGESYLKPTLSQAIFPNSPDFWFWTSSRFQGSPDGAWYGSFHQGHISFHNIKAPSHVRLVRAGQ